MIDEKTYSDNVSLVIDNLEGGYYHPNMLKDGRVKDSRYGTSGETMFGIDRRQGGSINDTVAGKQFWALIDNAGAKDKWKWNYMGGDLAQQLKDLAAKMMKPQYDSLANTHLTPQAKALVNSDPRLLFNFIYATWNGSGWFKQFAKKINDSVASGVTDTDQLTKVAVAARTGSSNSLISQGGNKIASLVDRIKQSAGEGIASVEESISTTTKKGIQTVKSNPIILVAGAAFIGLSFFMAYKYFSSNSKTV